MSGGAAARVTAPAGSLWARDGAGAWHVLRTAQGGDPRGLRGAASRHMHAVCGTWHSVGGRLAGRWAELTGSLPPAPRLCPQCLAAAPDAAAALCQVPQEPVAEQGRLL